MNKSNLLELADEIAIVRNQIGKAASGVKVDEYQEKAFEFICSRLLEMEDECRCGDLKPVECRYPELARIAVESDPEILSPELGGKMIEIEKMYQQAR